MRCKFHCISRYEIWDPLSVLVKDEKADYNQLPPDPIRTLYLFVSINADI